MTRAVLIPADRWGDVGPGFDRQAAEVVYKAMAAMEPDEALIFGRALVAESMQHEWWSHHSELNKAYEEQVEQRATALNRYYSREAVAKARRGQDNTRELAYLVQIGKAWPRFVSQQHPRDPLGRFVQTGQQINTDTNMGALHEKHAESQGIPSTEGHLSGNDLSHYQQAYRQIRDLVHPFRSPDLNALVHLNVRARNNAERTELGTVRRDGTPAKFHEQLNAGDRITSVSVSVNPKHKSAASAAFDTFAAAGAPTVGAHVAGAYAGGALDPDRLARYNKDRQGTEGKLDANEVHSGATRAFGSLARGSQLLQQSLGENAPRQLTYALAVANHIGQFGPEAQKVIGPFADRTAYRYRGTERAPSARLQREFDAMRTDPDLGNRADRRRAVLDGTTIKIGTREVWDPQPVLEYFRNKLPNPDLNELQRKSGVVPPSEGIILNRNGGIATQASGYADDWYLPFNLKHLKALKDGDYIRTRTFGGPTTEDIYTGLLSGARSLTVVSHSGVYNIQFDNTFRGGRRLNDKAARMVGRYGHLLDALRSNGVYRGDVSHARQDEIHDEIANTGQYREPEGTPQHEAMFQERMADERRRPVMAQADRNTAAVDWLDTVAARRTTHGRVQTGAQMVEEFIDTRAKEAYAAARKQQAARGEPMTMTQDQVRDDIRTRILGQPFQAYEEYLQAGNADVRRADQHQGNVTVLRGTRAQRTLAGGQLSENVVRNIAEAMNMGPGFEAHMSRAEKASRERVQSLQLNGRGYYDGLQALREQFPYYIHQVTYHEWRGTAGIGNADTREGKRDTGYVAPRHNRPEEAQSGYFNRAITGHGKVSAQTTRFQNYRVNRGVPGQVSPPNGTPERRSAAAATAAAAVPAAAAAAPQAAEEARQQADLDMLHALKAQTHFAAGATVNGVPIAGEAIHSPNAIENPGWPDKDFANFHRLPEAQLAEQLRDPNIGPGLRQTMATMAAGGLVAVDPQVHQAFLNEGRVEPPTALPGDTRQLLGELGQDHVFPGIAFDPTRVATREQIGEAFDADTDISRLKDLHGLADVSDPKLPETAGPIAADLAERHGEHIRITGSGDTPDRREVREVRNDTEALARALQLHRRYAKAPNAPKPPEPEEPASTTTTTNAVYIVDAAGNPQPVDPAALSALQAIDPAALQQLINNASGRSVGP